MAEIISTPTSLIGSGSAAQGFSFPLSGNAVFNPTYTAEEVIRTNLINWLLTNKGERVMKPNFVANLRDFIGEGISDGTNVAIEDRIRDNIAINFPSIEVKEITFENEPDRNTINLFITYLILNIGIEDEINISLQ